MNYIKSQLASLLTEAARKGFAKLDKNSSEARELMALDVDAVVKDDVHLICETLSIPEIITIISLAAQLKLKRKNKEGLEEKIKKIARDVMARIEKQSTGLKIPPSCQKLLFNFIREKEC